MDIDIEAFIVGLNQAINTFSQPRNEITSRAIASLYVIGSCDLILI